MDAATTAIGNAQIGGDFGSSAGFDAGVDTGLDTGFETGVGAATGAGVAGTGDIVADLTGGVNSALQGALDAAGNAWSSIDVDAFGSGQSDAGLFANGLGDLGGHIDPVVVDPAAALDPGHDLLP